MTIHVCVLVLSVLLGACLLVVRLRGWLGTTKTHPTLEELGDSTKNTSWY